MVSNSAGIINGTGTGLSILLLHPRPILPAFDPLAPFLVLAPRRKGEIDKVGESDAEVISFQGEIPIFGNDHGKGIPVRVFEQ
jgi:hypothetical protein